MQIREDVSLAKYSTMQLGGNARYFATINNKEDLIEAIKWSKDKDLQILPLGEGSNTIFTDNGFGGLVIHNQINFIKIASEVINAGSGTHWDEVVAKSVDAKLSGIEALSAIPGTAGAAPVQNIGAYGQEIKDTLVSLELLDTKVMKFKTFSNKDCRFGYRDSIFKHWPRGNYIITSINIKLKTGSMKPPFYASLAKYLNENNIADCSPSSIRAAVMSIRKVRLPDPTQIPNTGSFFKNPIITKEAADKLLSRFPDIVFFSTNKGFKLSAGWLIEQCGFKGKTIEGINVYGGNALVLTNPNAVSYKKLAIAKKTIVDAVNIKFGVKLEQEPETIGD